MVATKLQEYSTTCEVAYVSLQYSSYSFKTKQAVTKMFHAHYKHFGLAYLACISLQHFIPCSMSLRCDYCCEGVLSHPLAPQLIFGLSRVAFSRLRLQSLANIELRLHYHDP